jgi:signal transduction histidine kinase
LRGDRDIDPQVTSAESLRAELIEELQSEVPNSDRIADLAAAIANMDASRARFSVDAAMLARLGRELMARHETALSELVKNAYDADAERVVVRISGAAHGDFIEVSDDGSGMTREALVHGFMRLATNDKIEQPVSAKFGRRRAGRKGVGRFAAERLGTRLLLTTATADAPKALQMAIDWERFTPGLNLGSVSTPIELVEKPRPHGTTLRIEKLRDHWPEATVERTFEHIAELIDMGDQTKSGARAGSSFSVAFSANGKDHNVFDIRSQVANQAYATIEADVDDSGYVTWSLLCAPLGISFSDRKLRVGDDESNVLKYARNARLVANYYLLQKEYFPATVFKTVQNYLSRHGGLRVYRNGFRVLPYGEQGDDWLSLDLLSSQRSKTLAPIRNRNFLGTVSVDDTAGLFEETSAREGFIGSPAFSELVQAMHAALVSGVREVDAERDRRELKRPKRKAVERLQDAAPERSTSVEIAKQLTQALSEAQVAAKRESNLPATISYALERAVSTAQEVARRASESDALLKEIDLLRVLASMGLAIGQFTHEFSTLSGAMRANLSMLMDQDRSAVERGEASAAIRALLDQAKDFTGLFKSMTEENALRDRQAQDIYEIATAFKSAMRTILQRNAVNMTIADDGNEILSPPMHRSELFAILLNFTTNSIKAIKRSGRAGEIFVRLSLRDDKGPRIEFSDNGDGVADEVRQTLFDAFVTTTAARGAFAPDDEIAIGSGLGLAIVRDIVSGVGGVVGIGTEQAGFATNMVVDLPGATE